MCCESAWQGGGQRRLPLARVQKRGLHKIQERQVDSVCIGIEHLMKRCKKNGDRTDQTLLPVTFPVNGENGPDDVVITHQQVCRLCESTRRVLRVARAHGSRPHDVHNCDACRMWSLVRARYNYLRRVEANNATATTTGSSRVLATSFSKV